MSDSLINNACIETLNKLLRGELSAVETYGKVLEKHPESSAAPKLKRMQAEHQEAADALVGKVVEMRGEPETDAGAWGSLANAIQAAANLFGTESAIESLQKGEEHGRQEYLDALENEDVLDACKGMIRESLLPRTERHVETLERLEEQVA